MSKNDLLSAIKLGWELFQPLGSITIFLTITMGLFKIAKGVIERSENRSTYSGKGEYFFEPDWPKVELVKSTCPYCGQKYEAETHYCSNCQTPF